MSRKNSLTLCLIVVALLVSLPLTGQDQPEQKNTPNVVLIFLDDMGNGDLSCLGALQYKTPNLDRLATEGIRFTNFLAVQAVCSASRAGLLTGCYPNRIGFHGALGPDSKIGIHEDEVTLGELVRQKGYHTAIFGKWHLGHLKQFLPLQNGFDEYYGLPYSNDMWPVDYDGSPATNWKKDRYPPLHLIEGNEQADPINTLSDQTQLTKRYTQKAVDFIHRNKDYPFFLYLPHSMPHVPIAASEDFAGKSEQGMYGDVMMEIDWSVGRVLNALREAGIEEHTLVIFTSDNGPWLNYGNHAGSTGGLREGKGTSFEGGQRVPCIMRWKGTIEPGGICNSLMSSIDIFPTIAALLKLKLPEHKIDGISFLPVLHGDLQSKPRKYFYYYYRENNLEAVRMDDWKLVLPHPGRTYVGFEAGRDGYPGEVNENSAIASGLYDLRRDPGERYDVQLGYPGIVKELEDVAEGAREDLGDNLTGRVGTSVRQPGRVK
jgi:arylsulfatase A-like enzyme